RTHVPHDPTAGVEVRRADVEPPTLAVFLRAPTEPLLGYHAVNHPSQRRTIGNRLREDCGDDPVASEDVLVSERLVHALRFGGFGRPEERERADQRPGADTGDDVELRARTGRGPTDENAGRVRAVRAAAADDEDVLLWVRNGRFGRRSRAIRERERVF